MNDPTPMNLSDDEQLQELLDGRLDDAEAAALRARIEREPALREAWEELRQLQALVRGYGPQGAELEVPADFLAGVKARIATTPAPAAPPAPAAGAAPSRRRPGRLARVMTIAYAAAALLVVGFTVRYVLDDGPAPAGSTETARTNDEDELSETASYYDQQAPAEGAVEADAVDAAAGERGDAKPQAEAGRAAAGHAPQPARAGKQVGAYAGPGGHVPPGTRPPPGAGAKAGGVEPEPPADAPAQPRPREPATPPAADTPQRPHAAAKEPAEDRARRARLARLLASKDTGPVYVLEVTNVAAARRELAALLGDASLATVDGRDARSGADAGVGVGAGGRKPPRRSRRGGSEDGDGHTAGKLAAAGLGRLYRVDARQTQLLVAALHAHEAGGKGQRRAVADGADDEKEAERDKAGPTLALLDLLTPEVDAAGLRRLDARAVSGVWSGTTIERLARKAAPPKSSAAPVPATPSAPDTPSGPQKREPAGDEPATGPAAEKTAGPRAKKLRSRLRAPETKARRVRILLVERRR